MKLAPLLAQYLYSTKRLDLRGIGSFLLDPSVNIDPEPGKQQKPAVAEGITFESNPATKESAELISYISAQSGKMKALAAADLDSFLELAQQFLNIGKPFMLEGIGSIVKIRSGQYEFTPGTLLTEKLKDLPAKEKTNAPTAANEESFNNYNPMIAPRPAPAKWRKPVLAFLIVAGVGLAVWGGYTISKRFADKNNTVVAAAADTNSPQTVIVPETTIVPPDSIPVQATQAPLQAPPPVTTAALPAGEYKYVLETANRKRAFERYNKLKTYEWNVNMETKDSVVFKLYLVLPTLVQDTARVRDSLSVVNGRKVYIETK